MNKNYLTYPTSVMNITQRYDAPFSHLPCSTGVPADYPIDEACSSGGREWFYCPCNEMKAVMVYGVGTGGTNTLFLESTSKVAFADGTEDYCSILVMHPNDDDLSKIKTNQTFKRGEKICREGTDGYATGNHFHISAGKGKFKSSVWVENSKGQWVLNTTKGAYKPEKLFYVDKTFTKVKNAAGISFKALPEEKAVTEEKAPIKESTYTRGDYRVTDATLLYVRTGPGTNNRKKTFDEFTENAQKQVKELAGYKANGYVMGVEFTASQVDGNWGKTPSGWVCLDYCTKI